MKTPHTVQSVKAQLAKTFNEKVTMGEYRYAEENMEAYRTTLRDTLLTELEELRAKEYKQGDFLDHRTILNVAHNQVLDEAKAIISKVCV